MEKVFEIYIRTTPERLWKALTDGETRSQYQWGCRVRSDWKPGSRYEMTGPDGAALWGWGENLEVERPHRLVQTMVAVWNEEVKSEGASRVGFEIEPVGDSCRLTVTHGDLREGAHGELYGGWPMILSALKTLLETGERLTTPASLRFGQRGPAWPAVVPEEAWRRALEALRAKEKAATRARDALAAERRRLPRLRIEKDWVLQGAAGPARLADLFEGRRQLLLYHFMFGASQELGCPGCSMFVDQIGHPAHLHARDTSFALVSRAPLAKLEAYRRRMGWTLPWYSSFGTDFSPDFGVGPTSPRAGEYQDGETFGLSVLLREGDEVYRTYFTTARGVEALGSVWTLLDLTPLGRQEKWEDSPPGHPQTAPYEWWRRHDEYDRRG